MKRSAMGHTKLKKLSRRLSIPSYAAVGLLECLWHLTAREAPRGDIGKLSDEDICVALDWDGDEGKLIGALVEARWLDASEEHRLLVHDWHDHADDATKKAISRNGLTFATVGGQSGDVTGNVSTSLEMSRLPEPEPEPSQPSVEQEEDARCFSRHEAGWLTEGVPVAPTDSEMDGAVRALGRKPVASDGMIGWHVASGPIREVGLALAWANVLMGQPVPDERKPPRYVGENQGCRRAVDRKGWRRAAEIYEWAVRKGKTTSWTTLNDQIDAYETQMENGTEWVERKPTAIRKPTMADQNAAMTREYLDRRLKGGQITKEQYDEFLATSAA